MDKGGNEINEVMVSVFCETFNHEPFIRQCLDGMLMQKTDFAFEVLIHDDASTDHTQMIIKEYAEKYPDIIKPILQHENQYSKGVGIWQTFQMPRARGKYIALCEGDDYWTDPLKLQKQVDFLEGHEEYCLCCSDALVLNQGQMESWKRYTDDCRVPVEDIVIGGGLWLQTVTFVYRNGLLNNYPDCCRKCHVGDYPLIIWAALNGGVYYLHDETGVYRFQSAGSWTLAIKNKPIESLMKGWRSEVEMLKGLDEWSSGMYSGAFCRRIRDYYFNEIICRYKRYAGKIESGFPDLSCYLSKVQRIRVWFIRLHIEKLYFHLKKIFILLKRC